MRSQKYVGQSVLSGYHSMNRKSVRLVRLLNFLRLQSAPLTVTEIHEALVDRLDLQASRRTITRDLEELLEDGLIKSDGIPKRFFLCNENEVILRLTREEAHYLLGSISTPNSLIKKLKIILGV